jgi:hypothetical protein
VLLGLIASRARHTRVFVLMPWSLACLASMYLLGAAAGPERQLVVASALLTLSEVSIIAAVATFFASFSSPSLTAAFTIGVFVVGRSADTLANLPQKMFGPGLRDLGRLLAKVFPNLQVYVPPRPLLLGEVSDVSLVGFCASATAHALFYATVLLVLSALIFRRRDFQ